MRRAVVHYDGQRRRVGFHVEPRGRACRVTCGRRRGSVAERPNALALKASVPKQHRGFKSLHFRTGSKNLQFSGLFQRRHLGSCHVRVRVFGLRVPGDGVRCARCTDEVDPDCVLTFFLSRRGWPDCVPAHSGQVRSGWLSGRRSGVRQRRSSRWFPAVTALPNVKKGHRRDRRVRPDRHLHPPTPPAPPRRPRPNRTELGCRSGPGRCGRGVSDLVAEADMTAQN